MAGFIEGADRTQTTLLPECLDDWVDESNPIRFIDAFVERRRLTTLQADEARKRAKPRSETSIRPIGLWLAPIDDELRRKHSINAKTKGVVVTQIDPESAAAKRGMKVGDVVVKVGQSVVTSVADVPGEIEWSRHAGRKAVQLQVESFGGELRLVALPID